MTARQSTPPSIKVLSQKKHDKGKSGLMIGLGAVAIVLVGGGLAAAVMLKRKSDRKNGKNLGAKSAMFTDDKGWVGLAMVGTWQSGGKHIPITMQKQGNTIKLQIEGSKELANVSQGPQYYYTWSQTLPEAYRPASTKTFSVKTVNVQGSDEAQNGTLRVTSDGKVQLNIGKMGGEVFGLYDTTTVTYNSAS